MAAHSKGYESVIGAEDPRVVLSVPQVRLEQGVAWVELWSDVEKPLYSERDVD